MKIVNKQLKNEKLDASQTHFGFQHGVRNAYFQSYSQNVWVTLYIPIPIFRNVEHIPLVDSMHFVRTVTQMSSLLLNHLLELESTFFMRKSKKKAEEATKSLREEIIAFIIQSCHFLESLYDPYFQWRAYMLNGTPKVKLIQGVQDQKCQK